MKTFILFIALLGISPQFDLGTRNFTPASGGCTAPTMTYRWAAYNPSNTCGTTGASSCTTNGQAFFSVADFVAGNTASQSNTSDQPLYETNQINSLPAIQFNGSTTFLTLSSPISSSASGIFTFYAVMSISTGASHALIGPSVAGGLEYITDGGITLLSSNFVAIANGTLFPSVGTFYTLVMTYNATTGAYTFAHASAGSLVSDASGTATPTAFVSAMDQLGAATNAGDHFNGDIAEWGFLTSVNTTGIAAWSNCKYGI